MGDVKASSFKDGIKSFFAAHKKALIFIAAFLIPVLIWLCVLWSLDMYPWGTKTSLFMDLKGQYAEFLASLKHMGNPDNSLLFNWSRTMGGNAIGLYAYYSGGLIAFIACLFPTSMIYAAVTVIEAVAIGLCGLSFAVFATYGLSKNKPNYSTLIFSTCYALMSYFVVYSACYMWLMGGVFLPLVMLGIEKIIEGKKGFIFYISLALAMISNYYTAYMIVLFSFMYFILRIVSEYTWEKGEMKNSFKKSGVAFLKYAGLGALSAMTALPVILPVYLDLVKGKLAGGLSLYAEGQNIPFAKIFHKFLPGQYDTITMPEDGAYPSVYVGIIVLIFVLVFFFQKKRKFSEKMISAIIVCVFLLSFWSQKLDIVWMGLQRPTWFPYRYAFLLGFFMVFMGYRAYQKWFENEKHIPNLIPLVLIIACCFELFYNAKVCVKGLGDQFGYMETAELQNFLDSTEPLVDEIKEDEDLYRVNQDYEFSKNDSMLLGYNGMTHYSSTYNYYICALMNKLGIAQAYDWNTGYGATPLLESLFGIRYRLSKKINPSFYDVQNTLGDVTLYRNDRALPFAFCANSRCKDTVLDQDVFSNQNKMMATLTDEDKNYFNPVEYERNDEGNQVNLHFVAADDKPVYMFLNVNAASWGDVYVNEQWVNNCFSYETLDVIYLGTFAAGQDVNVAIRSDNMTLTDALIETLDTAMLTQDLEKLYDNSMEVDEHNGNGINGTINVPAGKTVVTSIPYDEGFTIKVDDEKVDYDKWVDAFVTFDAPEGEHEISITYSPPGYGIGWIALWISIVIAISYFCFDFFYKKRLYKRAEL